MSGGGLIDMHAHFLPESDVRAAERAGVTHPDGIARWPSWSPAAALELMDSVGVASAVLSVSSPGLLLGEPTDAVARALAELRDASSIYPDELATRLRANALVLFSRLGAER